MNPLEYHELTQIWYTLLSTEKELNAKEKQLREEISELLLNRVLTIKEQSKVKDVTTGL